MILSKNSIFRFLPHSIDSRSLLILDSLRFTLEMIDYNWKNLNRGLLKLSKNQNNKDLPLLFINTWSMLDNIKRFINLYKQLPSTSNHRLVKTIEFVKEFRHTYQHIDERIDELILKSNIPIYGILHWLYKNDERKVMEVFLAISGIFYNSSPKFTYWDYEHEKQKISHLILETVDRKDKTSIDLCQLISDFRKAVKEIEFYLEYNFNIKGLQKADWSSRRDILIRVKN